MRLIPSSDWNTKSSAEVKAIQWLALTEMAHAICLHSLNLSRHMYKRCGELDFVLICPAGVYVLEVKGGGVSCQNGIWTYTDRYGDRHRSSEGPFKQAQSGMFSLEEKLRENLPPDLMSTITMGYGVILPDCTFRVDSVEWPSELIADETQFTTSSAGPFLKRVISYWHSKNARKKSIEPRSIATILKILRPNFEVLPSLNRIATDLDCEMHRLTTEQYGVIDAVERNPRILCEGGAGTGKTFVAAELARREASQGKSVLFTCKSASLVDFLKHHLTNTAVQVVRWADAEKRSDRFDKVIVDEGQDLLTMQDLARLDKLIAGGLDHGSWCFFHDPNNQSGLYQPIEQDALELLQSSSVIVRLNRNCRNTSDIVIQTRLLTGADLGVATAGHGPAVRMDYYKDQAEAARKLESLLFDLHTGGAELSEIAILSPMSRIDSSIRLLGPKWQKEIVDTDRRRGIRFSEIQDFKGLESRYVIVTDIDNISGPRRTAELYVSMSRGRAGLFMLFNACLRPAVEQLCEMNIAAVLASVNKN